MGMGDTPDTSQAQMEATEEQKRKDKELQAQRIGLLRRASGTSTDINPDTGGGGFPPIFPFGGNKLG